jgi:hypothetical protein
LVVASGTVWGGPSSVLTRFLEVMTPYEMTDTFLGKPAAVVTTMDATGGVEAGSRLLTTLSLLGCALPPAALVVLSRRGRSDDDVWGVADLAVLAHNLVMACAATLPYRAWPVRAARPVLGAYPAVGGLDLRLPRVLRRHR